MWLLVLLLLFLPGIAWATNVPSCAQTPNCVCDPGSQTAKDIPIWIDDGTPAWELRALCGDMSVSGSEVCPDSSFTRHGPWIGDENEVYHANDCGLDGYGQMCIDDDDDIFCIYPAGGPVQCLYPKRQSFLVSSLLYIPGQLTTSPVYSAAFAPGILANYGSSTTEDYRTSIAPVGMQCDEIAVCGMVNKVDTDEDIEITLRKNKVDTTLTCTVDGGTSASVCTGADDEMGCSTSVGTPVSFSQYDRATLEMVCSGNCPTDASVIFYYVTLRCWTTE